MNFWICKIFIVGVLFSVSFAYDFCSDRHCYIARNDKNEDVFDCSLEGNHTDTIVECTFHPYLEKLFLSVKESRHISIDKIEPGAFSRLVSKINVRKIYVNKLRFNSLKKEDFEGLQNISEMFIENPITLASDTFLSLANNNERFILTISCVKGNKENSFESLFLKSKRWIVHTQHCNKELTCQYSACKPKSLSTMTKITSSKKYANTWYQISSSTCSESPSCINDQIKTIPDENSKKILTTDFPITTPTKTPQKTIAIEKKSEEYYDTLMYFVLIVTSLNSVIILAILVFLIFWWNKLSNSTANNKHTIILDDEDDTKYLDSKTYA